MNVLSRLWRKGIRTAAARFRVSVKFVNDMVILKRETGGLEPRRQGNGGGHDKLGGLRGWIAMRLAAKPDLTLDDLGENSIQYEAKEKPPVFFDVDAFLASGIYDETGAVTIEGVTYRMRDDEPLHNDHKVQDSNGVWWSPDYLVVVAAGQSNMKGAAKGGDWGQAMHERVLLPGRRNGPQAAK